MDEAAASKRKAAGNPSDIKGPPPSKKPRINTAVYVTSIPLDADSEEISRVFSRCGVIAEEIDSGDLRIKMYEDEEGKFKGDALVVYFRPESVQLAIQMLDDTEFRFGVEGPVGKMRVQAADSSYKKVQQPGEGTAVKSAAKRTRDQQKIIRKTQKLNRYVCCCGRLSWRREGRGGADTVNVVSLRIGTMMTLQRYRM
jgi:HIV Tat-specific factor 1